LKFFVEKHFIRMTEQRVRAKYVYVFENDCAFVITAVGALFYCSTVSVNRKYVLNGEKKKKKNRVEKRNAKFASPKLSLYISEYRIYILNQSGTGRSIISSIDVSRPGIHVYRCTTFRTHVYSSWSQDQASSSASFDPDISCACRSGRHWNHSVALLHRPLDYFIFGQSTNDRLSWAVYSLSSQIKWRRMSRRRSLERAPSSSYHVGNNSSHSRFVAG